MDLEFSLDFEPDQEPKQAKLDKATKLEKKQHKDAVYQEHKHENRKKKTQKAKQLRYEKLQKFATQEEKDAYLQSQYQKKMFRKSNGMQAQLSKFKVVIDCAFEESMGDREQRSLARQLAELYAENRIVKHPIKLYITNIYPTLEKYLLNFQYDKWPCLSTKDVFYNVDELKDGNFVYLTPDADEELQEIDENITYIIGGLVDKPIIKNATFNRANLLNVRKAKLPIGGMIKASFKKCLNVNTAAQLIPAWLEHRDWQLAFDKVVPLKFSKVDDEKQQFEQ